MDRYLLLDELGRGGMGVVFKAWDPELDRPVALKMLTLGVLASETQQQRFLREARLVARLDHAAIVRVYDWGRSRGCAYYTMDLVNGPTLKERLAGGPMSLLEAAQLIATIARAIHHAHQAGIVHRDIKPANILLAGGTEPRISDFGVARIEWDELNDLTATGQLIGTPAYMAPEQATGESHRVGPPSDIYELGAVLFHMLVGRPPAQVSLENRRTLEAPSPRQLRPEVPLDLDLICRKAIAPEPSDRYASALQLAEDAERFLRGEPVQASRPGVLRRVGWQIRRRRVLLVAATVSLLFAALSAWAWQKVNAYRAAQQDAARETEALARFDALRDEVEGLWKDGSDEAVRQALSEFLGLPQIRNTRAAPRGLLLAADHALRSGDLQGALEQSSRAYLIAAHPADQRTILLKLSSVLQRFGDATAVQAVDALLARNREGASGAVGDIDHQRAMALARRAVPEILELLDPADRARLAGPLRALSSGEDSGIEPAGFGTIRRTRGLERDIPSGDLRARASIVLTDAGGTVSGQARFASVRAPEGKLFRYHLFALGWRDGAPVVGATLTDRDGLNPEAGLFQVVDGQLEPLFSIGSGRMLSACHGDLDGDGVPEYYLSREFKLFTVLSDEKGGFRMVRSHAGTDATRSEVKSLVAWDLDGDGRQELVAGMDGWHAYDLRVFRGGRTPGTLELAARRKLGPILDVAPLPLPGGGAALVASRYFDLPNLQMFAPQAPSGLPRGTYVLRWEGNRLELVAGVPVPFADALVGTLSTGDFDGDGSAEVAADITIRPPATLDFAPDQHYLQLIAMRDDGQAASIALPGLAPRMSIVAPGGARSTVMVLEEQTKRVWTLGAGRTPLPMLSSASHASGMPASEPKDAWARAEDLLFVGVFEHGVEPLSQFAEVASDPADAAAALRRQGDIAAAKGQLPRAAELYQRAAGLQAPSAQASIRAAELLRRLWRHDEELAVLEQVVRHPAANRGERESAQRRVAELQRIAARPVVSLTFSERLDARWSIDAPALVRRDSSRNVLRVRTHGDLQDLARFPLRWEGGRLTLEAEMDVPHIEQGVRFFIGLRPPGARSALHEVNAEIEAWGGGSLLNERVTMGGFDVLRQPVWEQPIAGPSGARRLKLRLELDPEGRELAATFNGVHKVIPVPPSAWGPPGDLELVFRSSRWWPVVSTVAELEVSAIRIHGATLSPPQPPSPEHEARRLIAEGRFDEADKQIALLPANSTSRLELALVTACELGASPECRRQIERAARKGDVQRAALVGNAEPSRVATVLKELLRQSPDVYLPAMLRAFGRSAVDVYWCAWTSPAESSPEYVPVQLAMTTGLAAIDFEALPLPSNSTALRNEIELLLMRGRAWRLLKQPRAAWSTLQYAATRAARLIASFDAGSERLEMLEFLAEIELEAARAYSVEGHLERALERLKRGLELSPMPEVLADKASTRPEIEPYLRDPPFAALLHPPEYRIGSGNVAPRQP